MDEPLGCERSDETGGAMIRIAKSLRAIVFGGGSAQEAALVYMRPTPRHSSVLFTRGTSTCNIAVSGKTVRTHRTDAIVIPRGTRQTRVSKRRNIRTDRGNRTE